MYTETYSPSILIFSNNASLIFLSLVTISFVLILISGASLVQFIAKLKTDETHCSFAAKYLSSLVSRFVSTTFITDMGNKSLTQFFKLISSQNISHVGFFFVNISIKVMPQLYTSLFGDTCPSLPYSTDHTSVLLTDESLVL